MSLLRQRAVEGGRAALAAFGVVKTAEGGFKQPGFKSVGIQLPKASDLPPIPPPSVPSPLGANKVESDYDFVPKLKKASNVGMGASTSTDGAGAQAGEPEDTGRRQRSVIDRAFQRNDDDYATSSMPLPGDVVAP
jgi:hypothetical protein